MRNWKLGEVAWGWPDDVDKKGTETAGGYRYIPIWQTDGALGYQVARVYVDEDDAEQEQDLALLVAAPEMLAALRLAHDALDFAQAQVESESDAYQLRKWRVAVGRAISKAEGHYVND